MAADSLASDLDQLIMDIEDPTTRENLQRIKDAFISLENKVKSLESRVYDLENP